MASEAELLSPLIADIYDAALDPARWPFVLERTAGFVGGTASSVFIKDSAYKIQHDINWGYDPHFRKLYYDDFAKLDPFTTAQFFFSVGEVISLRDVIPYAEFLESRFYQEWVRPQGWVDAVTVTLDKSATSYAAAAVVRHERNGVVNDAARRRMRLLAPHIRRAVLIGKAFDLHKAETAALADTLAGLAAGVFLVDANGHIVFANAVAQVMLGEEEILRSVRGALVAPDPHADRALRDVFAATSGDDAAVGTKGIAVPLPHPNGERWLAHVLPLISGMRRQARLVPSATAALFVRKAALDTPSLMEAIAKLYKLTPSELRVLNAVVEVGGVPSIAVALGISEATVKTHLHHVFTKTGTMRQAELVKLVAGHASPFRDNQATEPR